MQRRTFIKKSGVAIAGLVTIPSFSFSQDAPSGLVFDAMGEIRTIYTMDLVDQILASGTRAISHYTYRS
jgi:hypothetical protein